MEGQDEGVGDAQELSTLLGMLCPLSDPETGQPISFDGRVWPTDTATTLTTLCALPERTRAALRGRFPALSLAAREHLTESVGTLAGTVADTISAKASTGSGRLVPPGAACRALAVNVSNALAFAPLLDGLFGSESEDGVRSNMMPVALKVFETGALPHPAADASEDADAFVHSVFPLTDYLAADDGLRRQAGAYLMAFSLAFECNLQYTEWASLAEPPEAVTALAREHLDDPGRWAAAVRANGTLDARVLRDALRHDASD